MNMNINMNINMNMNMNMNMNNHHHHHHHQIITQEDAEELILLFPTTEAKRPAAKASKTQQVQQYRSRHGMTKSGYVLRTTPVVFDIPMHHCHPFVHSIGRNFVRSFPSHIHNELTMLEQYMDKVLTKQREFEFGDRKQYQYNLGLRIVPAKRKRGSASTPPRQLPSTASSVASISSSSGTILRESTLRLGYPDLYNSLIETLGAAIQEAYGKQPWFKRMKALCRNLRQQTGQDRTFPNMPVSTIRRLSHVRDGPPIQIEARDDPHCVGPGFVIATYPNENNEFEMICLATNNDNDNNSANRTRTVVHAPKPSTIHAGAWDSDPPSFRFRSEAQSQSQSQSQVPNFWVLYLDGRVFSSRYTMGGGY